MPYPTIDDLTEKTALILDSYARFLGKELIERTGNTANDAEKLIHASKIVLSCDAAPDPVLNFANLQALKLWEWTWEQMTATPAKETAEPDERSAREKLLQQVKLKGYADDYTGIRISRTGKKFRIKQACVWNLIADDGIYIGQAAAFDDWEYV